VRREGSEERILCRQYKLDSGLTVPQSAVIVTVNLNQKKNSAGRGQDPKKRSA
jgi:hypothetical protein